MYSEDHIQKVLFRVRQVATNPFKLIENKTGISRTTINRFFSGVPIRRANQDKIFEACLEIIDEKQQKQLELKNKSEKLMQLKFPFRKPSDKRIVQ